MDYSSRKLAVDERRQDERGDDEADYLHDDEHRHRLARDARDNNLRGPTPIKITKLDE